MRASLLILACAITASWASTAGRRFQLVFLENIVERPEDGPLEVYVSNIQGVSATVTVSSPRANCVGETATVAANTVRRFDVCWWMRAMQTDLWPSFKTILVESSEDVMVYGLNQETFSADGFYAIPTSQIAETYYVLTYGDANIATQFAISATTQLDVQITLPSPESLPVQVNYRGLIFTNGGEYTISLSQYESYVAKSRGDLSGTRITATAPIAVFAGNVRNLYQSTSRDHVAAQFQAVGDWGTEYYLAPVERSSNFGDWVQVMGEFDATTFNIRFVNGAFTPVTLALAGDFYSFTLDASVSIVATDGNKPLQITQMVQSQNGPRISDVADPAMFLPAARSQWLNDYISPPLRYSQDSQPYAVNYALITVATSQRSGIRVNNQLISASWVELNDVSIAWISVGGSNQNRFTHNTNQRFGVSVYGASDRESYGFALGADLSNSRCQVSLSVRGDDRDNDCDGQVDEETCNKVDDDNDGLIDEDCRATSTEAVGNDYVIMFMENNVDDNPAAQSFLEVYMSLPDPTATVNYTLQSEEGTVTGQIVQNEVEIVELSANLRQSGNGIDTKAIRITAEADVVVYALNKQTASTDGFLAFPTDVVGEEYYTAHYWPGTDLNEFGIAAVADGVTTITVTMPSNTNPTTGNVESSAVFQGQTIAPGGSVQLELNATQRQTAQFQAASQNDNLNGAHIVSDKPICVFSGNVRARVDPTARNSRDHLVHQLAPVNTWGREFVTTPAPRTNPIGDKFVVTGSRASTVIVNMFAMDGSTSQQTYQLNGAGDTATFDIGTTSYARIQTSEPAQLFQYVKTTTDPTSDNADPAMILYPPVEQWSKDYAFVGPRTGQPDGSGGFVPFTPFVMIAIDSNQRNGLRLDGAPLNNPTWVELTGSPYAATTVEVSPTTRHSLAHIDSAVYFQATMYGRANRESFGLPLGLRLIAQQCVPSTQVDGDGVDNDCDGSIDEELCNEIDDDADGSVDEDCSSGTAAGSSFYLTYMENTVERPRDFDLELYVAVVGNDPAVVTVRTPSFTNPEYNSQKEVSSGSVQGFGFTWELRNVGQGVTGKSVFVRATSDVVVYAINKELFSNDGFLVYPENALGSTYYTVSYSPSSLDTEFAIVATLDNTRVTINLPSGRNNINVEYSGTTYQSGDTFIVTLDRFQVYQAQSPGDLTGTYIESDKRVAVFSGNVRTKIDTSSNSRDHLVQQMLPIGSYNRVFNLVPYPERTNGDVVRVIASASNTVVTVDGTNRATLQAGQYFEFELSSSSVGSRVSTSQNAMVVQFGKSQNGKNAVEKGDPSMFIVPSVNNYVSSATFITPVYSGGNTPGADYTNFLSIIIINGQQGNLRLNGSPLPTNLNWRTISSTSYVTATVDIPSGRAHTLRNTAGSRFFGRLYGRADRESYAFGVGMQF